MTVYVEMWCLLGFWRSFTNYSRHAGVCLWLLCPKNSSSYHQQTW